MEKIMLNSTQKLGIIYAGGTFGSHGQPLKSLNSDKFLPILQNILTNHFDGYAQTINWEILPNNVVKDSSQLTPSDFADFYQLIINSYQQGFRQFLILTGTDTLSYLSAFLAESLANSDVCVVVTGAMQPLLQPLSPTFEVNETSDASENLFASCRLAVSGEMGVKVCFNYANWHAQTVQKFHSHDLTAFKGSDKINYPANSFYTFDKQNCKNWLNSHFNNLTQTVKNLSQSKITPIFITPMMADDLAKNIQNALNDKPNALILLGFGAGNIPHNDKVETALQQAFEQNCLVAITTQCPFGGVSGAYEAGTWLAKYYVLTTGELTIPAIFARLLWLSATVNDFGKKMEVWQNLLNQ